MPVNDNGISISMGAIEIPFELNDLITSEPTTSSSSKPTQKIIVTEPPQSKNTPTSTVPTSEPLTYVTPTSDGNASYAPTTHNEIESSTQLSTNPSIAPSLHYDSAKPTMIATPTTTFKVNFQVTTDMPSTTQVMTATSTDLLSKQDQIIPQETTANKFVSIDSTAVTVTVLMFFMLTIMLGLLVMQQRQISSRRDTNTYISMNNSGLIQQTDSIVDIEQYTNIFESLVDRESSIRKIASEVRKKETLDVPPTVGECATSIIRPITSDEDINYKSVFTQCGMLQNLCVSPTNRPSTEPYATDELLPVDVVYTYTEAPHSKRQQVPPIYTHIGTQQVISPRCSEQSL